MALKSTGISTSYIFDGAGDKRDQLEQAVLEEFKIKQYPLPVVIQEVKSGGFFLGTKEQCVCITVDKGMVEIYIACTTVGTYLYVEAYLFASSYSDLILESKDVFKLQRTMAAYTASVQIMESAFAKLQLEQSNSGYNRTQNIGKSVKA
jgi:hypothetical protein